MDDRSDPERNFMANVRARRTAASLSQERLADLAHMPASAVTKSEWQIDGRMDARPLRLNEAYALAAALGASLEALVESAPLDSPARVPRPPRENKKRYDLMTLPEVAEYLRLPVATLRYWRHTGIGPRSAKLGSRIAYRRTDVETWLDQQFENSETS